MKFFFLSFIAVSLVTACHDKKADALPDSAAIRLELITADKEFSSLSHEKGMKNAFIDFIDSNGVLLRPNHVPIAGANAIDYLIQQDDSDYTLTWDPQQAEVAASGDLGYTYGVYALRPREKDTVIYGTYISIWKRQKDGKWKLVLDSGNEGIGED
jgi:ketosteroid isomerase-like protein